MDKFEELDFNQRYLNARKFFWDCIANPENSFLNDEIDVPIDSIIIKDSFVRVTFNNRDIESFIIETKIDLFSSDNKEIGWYSYIEKENGEIIDDFLVFT